jgi:hypothetical protein
MPDPKALDQYSVEELRAELKAREAHQPPSELLHDFSTPAILEVLLRKETALYGTASALDLYQVSDPGLLQDADSVVALFDQDDVHEQGETASLQTRPFGTAYNLCRSERFLEQPTGAFGAGCLVGLNLIATAGRLVDQENLGRVRFVFGFQMKNAQTPVTEIHRSEIYRGIKIVGREVNEGGADWALVQLDRPVMGHRIARVRSAGKLGDSEGLHVIGHPLGLPAKLASGARVTENMSAGFFGANLATYGGDIGSPVFNSQTHEVEGILVRGETAFVANGTCQVTLVCPSTGCRGRECTRSTEFASVLPRWRDWIKLGGPCQSPPAVRTLGTSWFAQRDGAWALGEDGRVWTFGQWGGQPDSSPYGGIGILPPAVASRDQYAYNVFMIGHDSALYHRLFDSSLSSNRWTWSVPASERLNGLDEQFKPLWSPDWERLGGRCASPAAVVSWDPQRLDVFVLGGDHAIWHQAWNGTKWMGWQSLGGLCTSPPAVCSWGPNRLDVFAIAIDHTLQHQAWDGTAWSGWQSLGGAFNSPPVAVSRGPNLLDVFVLGTDAALRHLAWNGAAWSDWTHFDGPWSSPPAVCSWGVNRLDVLVLGTGSVLQHRFWDGSIWGDWEALTGLNCSSAAVVVSWYPQTLDVFVLGTNSALYRRSWY